MNCAVCGKDNQPGTRFCVHCGASLAAAQPAARPAPPQATATVPTRAVPAAATATMPPLGVNDTGGRTAANPVVPPPGTPAYEAEPRGGGGKILLAIGIAALVIAGGYVGYKIFGGSADVKDSFARFDTTSTPRSDSPATRPAAPAAPAKEAAPEPSAAATPPAEPARSEDKDKEKDKDKAAKAEGAKGDGAKADAGKTPTDADKAKASTAGAKGEGRAAKGAAGAATTPPGTPAGPAAPAPAARPAPPPPAAPAPAPVAPVQDRWAQMSEELQRCQKENLFNRIVCDQRVRLRFCDGYWGKVAQCPGNVVNPDRGQ